MYATAGPSPAGVLLLLRWGTHHQRCSETASQLPACPLWGVPVREITAKHCWACQQAFIIDFHWKLLTWKSVGRQSSTGSSWHQNDKVWGVKFLLESLLATVNETVVPFDFKFVWPFFPPLFPQMVDDLPADCPNSALSPRSPTNSCITMACDVTTPSTSISSIPVIPQSHIVLDVEAGTRMLAE